MKESLAISRAKKLVFLITKANWGGAQRYVHDLAIAAKKEGHEVLVAYGDQGEMIRRLAMAGVSTVRISSLTRDVKVGNDGAVYGELVRLFKIERPDVVHVNSAKAGGLGCLAARRAGVKRILFTAHGWAFNENRPALQKLIIWILSGITVLLSHETLCPSNAIVNDIRHFPFIRRKLKVIYHGIDAPALLTRTEARVRLAPNQEHRVWVGMASELHPTKRVQDALLAMQIVTQTRPEALLVVMGEGEERAELEEMISKLALRDHVVLAGFVPDAPNYLHAFDLFLHTSQSESFGFAIVEAGAAALPVVATGVGGILEIIQNGENGLLVPPRAPEQMASALLSLIADPTRAKKLGTALSETVRARFQKERMVRETLAEY